MQYQNVNIVPYPQGLLEIQAIKVKLKRYNDIYIMNIYNPGCAISFNEINHYLGQLGDSYLLLGDFNGHTKLLDSRCVRSNATGRIIEKLVENVNICLCTPLSFYTCVDAITGKRSCLDLCFASPNLAPRIQLQRLLDVGSDHIPVGIKLDVEPVVIEKQFHKKYKINTENLQNFNKKIKFKSGHF